MKHLQRIVLSVLTVLTAAGATACTAGDSLGEIDLPLTASTPDGTVFRLRDGTFQVAVATGGPTIGLSTEDDPDATTLHADLDAGVYIIELLGGWRMERSIAGGPFEPVSAELRSSNPLGFEVLEEVTSQLTFVFRVPGVGDVKLGGGLDVGIDVYTPCDPVAQTGCAAGERCTTVRLTQDQTVLTTCTVDGTIAEGGACVTPEFGSDDCVAGTICFDGVCSATCNAGDTSCSCAVPLFPDVSDAGACMESCDALAQDCADAGEACYPVGSTTACAPPTGDAGNPGAPCTYLNQCVEGSVCSAVGGPATGVNGCTFMCSVSGTGPTCADGPGAGYTCIGQGMLSQPDLGYCVDCTVHTSYCGL